MPNSSNVRARRCSMAPAASTPRQLPAPDRRQTGARPTARPRFPVPSAWRGRAASAAAWWWRSSAGIARLHRLGLHLGAEKRRAGQHLLVLHHAIDQRDARIAGALERHRHLARSVSCLRPSSLWPSHSQSAPRGQPAGAARCVPSATIWSRSRRKSRSSLSSWSCIGESTCTPGESVNDFFTSPRT